MKKFRAYGQIAQVIVQYVAVVAVGLMALALTAASLMAAIGQWQWIDIGLGYGGAPVENAGMYAQLAVTGMAIALCFFLPTNRRIMRLETSHRDFTINMQDVARAYSAAHAADRTDVFRMSSEFDSVRERLNFLREHPDLSTLEPRVLEVAAQMSQTSKELAEIYSDERVKRARQFLTQRQTEVEQFKARMKQAKVVSTELKQWLHEVEMEENVASVQLERFREEMRDLLPELDKPIVPRPTLAEKMPCHMRQDKIIIDLPGTAAE